ncbi:Hypothetical predicted protein [Pelobates cultripes]|uniref:WKF domain-containing protein n=1 Tax=Pelobates cultripes TaxID=61616 RepID=A0AAD1WDZ8_PELCU|nr:Hypothetical predicted protein [Pelobates cultripes]
MAALTVISRAWLQSNAPNISLCIQTIEITKQYERMARWVESPEMKDLEDLTPEEQRTRERKLKKERKKEEKRLKRESAIDDDDDDDKEKPSKPSVCELSLQYLKSWSEKRKDWKFQKTRQIWLLQNMYDQEKISDDYFPILLEYLEGLKGSARDTTVKQAEDLMKEYDKCEAQAESDVQKMSRIREVLQLLS